MLLNQVSDTQQGVQHVRQQRPQHLRQQRVAAIIPGLPEPADRGTYKRYRALIKELSRYGQVDCVCLADEAIDQQAVHRMRRMVHRLFVGEVSFAPWKSLWQQLRDPLPPNVRHWYDPKLAKSVSDFFTGKSYDLVFLGDLVSVPYAEQAELLQFPSIIDRARVDVGFQRQKLSYSTGTWSRKIAERCRIAKTAQYEAYVAQRITQSIVCSDSDATVLRQAVGSQVSVATVVNGIDHDDFLIADHSPPSPSS